jgi:predicted nucleic acid-binding protein
MRILVDCCVWSLALRRRSSALLGEEERCMVASLTEAIRNGQLAILGPIRQEILSGIRDLASFERVRSTLLEFQDETLTTPDYEEAARYDNLCRSRGIACGPIDMLICAVALRRHWSVLTLDRGLIRCMEALRAETPL